MEHGDCQLALYHGTNSIINVATLEGDQLSNQDWPWNPDKSVQRKVRLFIKVIPYIPKAKMGSTIIKRKRRKHMMGHIG
jgi:hypothetical protein